MEGKTLSLVDKRGHVYSCKNCSYKGEKRRVTAHIFQTHLTPDDWPYVCSICEFAHYLYPVFKKHIRWYIPHKMTGKDELVEQQEDMREESKVVEDMMVKLEKKESERYWMAKRRSEKPVSQMVYVTKQHTVPEVEVETPGLKKILPKPVLTREEKEVVDEFLSYDVPIELDYEEEIDGKDTQTPTCSIMSVTKGTMTDKGEIEKMQQKLSEQCTEICRLKQMLWERGVNPEEGKIIHNGLGTGESPKIQRVPKTPPKQLKSIVYKMPKRLTYSQPRKPEKKTRRQEWSDLFMPKDYRF